MNILIPMAGKGTRFPRDRYPLPKPLLDVNGSTMLERTIKSLDVDGKWHFVIPKNEFTSYLEIVISKAVPGSEVIAIDYVTEGPAVTAMLFKDKIDNKEPLIIANCDQIMEWSGKKFLEYVSEYDGAVVTYHSESDKNSFAKINLRGMVTEIQEKIVISNVALTGIHYWRQGNYFVDSVHAMQAANDRAGNGEFYVGPSYNYMIKANQSVGIYHIPNQQYHPVGIPLDYENFLIYDKRQTK